VEDVVATMLRLYFTEPIVQATLIPAVSTLIRHFNTDSRHFYAASRHLDADSRHFQSLFGFVGQGLATAEEGLLPAVLDDWRLELEGLSSLLCNEALLWDRITVLQQVRPPPASLMENTPSEDVPGGLGCRLSSVSPTVWTPSRLILMPQSD